MSLCPALLGQGRIRTLGSIFSPPSPPVFLLCSGANLICHSPLHSCPKGACGHLIPLYPMGLKLIARCSPHPISWSFTFSLFVKRDFSQRSGQAHILSKAWTRISLECHQEDTISHQPGQGMQHISTEIVYFVTVVILARRCGFWCWKSEKNVCSTVLCRSTQS